MQKLLIICFTGLGGLALWGQSSPLYENHQYTQDPQVDSTAVWNTGVIDISSIEPWNLQNTLFFTNDNSGVITSLPGYRLDYATETDRFPMDTFANYGDMEALDLSIIFAFGSLTLPDPTFQMSFFDVFATNIINSGNLQVGSGGRMKLEGENIDISRSGLRAGSSPGASVLGRGFLLTGNQYQPPLQLTENYWGRGQNQRLTGDNNQAGNNPIPLDLSLLSLPNPSSPPHEVISSAGTTNLVTVFLNNAGAYVYTNTVSATNWIIQAVFVPTNYADTNLSVDVQFYSDPAIPNDFPGTQSAIVRWGYTEVDNITARSSTNFVYLVDHLATRTNAIFLTNIINTNIFRPDTLEIFGGPPDIQEWTSAMPTNAAWRSDLLLSPEYQSDTVTNFYAAISGSFSPIVNRNPLAATLGLSHPAYGNPTNQAGRIVINAKNLDMTLTRVKADGLVDINVEENFKNDLPIKFDVPLVSVRAVQTNKVFDFKDVLNDNVKRFRGTISAWSGTWTNFMVTNDMRTNQIQIRFHALVVGGNFPTIVPVVTSKLNVSAENFVLEDNVNISEEFFVDSESFTANGDLFLNGLFRIQGSEAYQGFSSIRGIGPVNKDNFPRLKTFTNNATFLAPNSLTLGADREEWLESYCNKGTNSATTVRIAAKEFDNSGLIEAAQGTFVLEADDAKMNTGAVINAGGDVRITAREFKTLGSSIQAGATGFTYANFFQPTSGKGRLVLDVSDRLTDGGLADLNFWGVTDGFQLLRKPATGDLLGTVLESDVAQFDLVDHVWAAEDRGPTDEGFQDNCALSSLILDGQEFSFFRFSGPDEKNALYVDFLQLQGTAVDVENALSLAPGFTIYFRDSSPTAPEDLDGALDGRLVWAQDVTLATAQSSETFDVSLTHSENGEITSAELAFNAAAGASYRIESCDDLANPEWVQVETISNGETSAQVMSVSIEIPKDVDQRFYRAVRIAE